MRRGRSGTASAVVVDTSVLIKWFKTAGEELVAEARALRERVDEQAILVCAPSLLLYELGNILLLKSDLDEAEISNVFGRLESAGCVVVPPSRRLLRRAAGLGRAYGITFYDAAFVALAQELACPFITADRRLFGRIRALPNAHHLSRPPRQLVWG